MAETLMIPFIEPSFEVIQCYPHKIVLENDYIEMFSKAEVKFNDDDDGIDRVNWIDDVRMVLKKNVAGVELFKGKKHQTNIVRVSFIGHSVDSDFHFNDRAKAKEVYLKIKNWLLDANS